MPKKIRNIPSPDILMNSMRSIGYSFKSAMADIIDNSISAQAKNIWISFPAYETDNLYISILDDGQGMDEVSLLNAMKYGSYRESYEENDLGRFGVGLKSASLSQCKILTVASLKNGKISAYMWDLDSVIDTKEWDCLQLDEEEIKVLPEINKLAELTQGTLVIWRNFDTAKKKSDNHVYEYISEKMDETDYHIRLIFHRFMNRKVNPIKFYINNEQLTGFDPFLESHKKTDAKKVSEINVPYIQGDKTLQATIKIQPYLLPHQNDLENEDIEMVGGLEALKDNQGFFVYRNDRLIIYGTWFKLSARYVNPELYKYGRIKVDIPNTLDELWDIDIKKQNATIPKNIINLLRKSVINVTTASREKTRKRTKLDNEEARDSIWGKTESRDGKDIFVINTESTFIRQYLDEFEDKDKARILRLLDVISSSLPFDDISYSVCSRNNSVDPEEEKLESIILLGIEQFNGIKEKRQCTADVAFEKVCAYQPFNDEKIREMLRRRIYGAN